MATMVNQPISEAEAYVAEGAREISERLQHLIRQRRKARPRHTDDLVRAAVEHPDATAAAFVVGALLAALLADRLICRTR